MGKTKAFYRSVVLLFAELLLICTSVMWEPQDTGSIGFSLMYIILFCLGGYALAGTRKWLFAYITVGLLAIVLSLLELEWSNPLRLACQGMAFLLLFRAVIRHSFFSPKIPSIDRLLAGLAGYLLLGLFWENIFSILSSLHGQVLQDTVLMSGIGHSERLYFSFTTLTTLGYGDIIPVTPSSRVAATLCSLSGVIYLAVLISALTSRLQTRDSLKHIQKTDEQNYERTQEEAHSTNQDQAELQGQKNGDV